jgi:hypothetical protein
MCWTTYLGLGGLDLTVKLTIRKSNWTGGTQKVGDFDCSMLYVHGFRVAARALTKFEARKTRGHNRLVLKVYPWCWYLLAELLFDWPT